MDRTLFSPAMIDTFRACKRAYEAAQACYSAQPSKKSVASACRQFLRKGIAEINRGKITNPNEVQTFMGKHWPLEHVEKSGADPDSVARAFLYCYKTLMAYARSPYRPAGAEVVAVALKARSRVAHVRVYLEDTFDLILWYPERKQLEIVEYQLRSKRHFSSSWPSVSALVKRFLCERLRVRWPFETISLTTVKIGATSATASNTILDEAVYRLHFEEIVKDLESMKSPTDRGQHAAGDNCKFCESLSHRTTVNEAETTKDNFLSLSA
jgi:hypothetical protein